MDYTGTQKLVILKGDVRVNSGKEDARNTVSMFIFSHQNTQSAFTEQLSNIH